MAQGYPLDYLQTWQEHLERERYLCGSVLENDYSIPEDDVYMESWIDLRDSETSENENFTDSAITTTFSRIIKLRKSDKASSRSQSHSQTSSEQSSSSPSRSNSSLKISIPRSDKLKEPYSMYGVIFQVGCVSIVVAGLSFSIGFVFGVKNR